MNTMSEKGLGLTNLPSASGKSKSKRNKKIWHIYRQCGTNIHYYHLKPYKHTDVLVTSNINPDYGIDLVNKYNRSVEKKC